MGRPKEKQPEPAKEAEPSLDVETTYKDNQIVLSYHNANMIYEAKIQKRKQVNDTIHYFLHWNGWSKKWDEWVPEDKIIEKTEANIIKMKENNTKIKESNRRSKEPKAAKPKKEKKEKVGRKKKGGKKRKRGEASDDDVEEVDDTVELDSERAGKHEIKLKIPGQIKKYLITDWENITRTKLVTKSPASHTITKIFTEYLESKTKNKENHEVTHEVLEGLKEYFNKSLGALLLYRFERPQYTDLQKEMEASQPCNLYGAVHLSRLFVKLPELLSHTKMNTADKTLLQSKLGDLMKWLAKKPQFFEGDEYQTTDRDYHLRVDVDGAQPAAVNTAPTAV